MPGPVPSAVPRAAGRAARLGARYAAKYGAKYGPQVAVAWKLGGEAAVDATRTQVARRRHRHHALDQARSLVDGSVLRTRHGDEVVWLVFSGERVVASYPEVGAALESLAANVDPARRRTPEEVDAARLRARTRRLVADRARGPRDAGPPEPE